MPLGSYKEMEKHFSHNIRFFDHGECFTLECFTCGVILDKRTNPNYRRTKNVTVVVHIDETDYFTSHRNIIENVTINTHDLDHFCAHLKRTASELARNLEEVPF